MEYKSKKGILMMIIIWGSVIATLGAGLIFLVTGIPDNISPNIILGISLLITGFILLLIYFLFILPIKYIITNLELIVKSGILRWKIPLASIKEICPTRNPLSSPALSFDRLSILYGRHQIILISPENREDFLNELKNYAPGIEILD